MRSGTVTTATKTCAVLIETPVMPKGSSRLLLGKGLSIVRW